MDQHPTKALRKVTNRRSCPSDLVLVTHGVEAGLVEAQIKHVICNKEGINPEYGNVLS
jgi:hypothetical protein